jgi:hypothetical protein
MKCPLMKSATSTVQRMEIVFLIWEHFPRDSEAREKSLETIDCVARVAVYVVFFCLLFKKF